MVTGPGSRRRRSEGSGRGAAQERGQVLVWVVFLLPLLLLMVGLVVDGGFMWVQYCQARWTVDGAAVAAASEIDVLAYRDRGRVLLAPSTAWRTAMDYARRNNDKVVITRLFVENNVVYVEGQALIETVFMRTVGVGDFFVTVRGSQRPGFGISTGE